MRYVIGIDGGGSKTKAVILAEDGREWDCSVAESTNPHAVPIEQAFSSIAGLLDQVFVMRPLRDMTCSAVCLGLAGVDTEKERVPFYSFMEQYRKNRELAFVTYLNNDAQIALMATLKTDRGMIAIAGTGSIVYGLTPDGQKFRVGGWGHLLGDEGSGYDIGIRTLRSVMRSFDGREPPTALTRLVADRCGFAAITELRTYIYNPQLQKQDIARFAELCIQASESGDRTAAGIIRTAAQEMAVSAAALVRKHGWFASSDLVTAGSIFKHSPEYAKVFAESFSRQAPGVRIQPSDRDPAYGAALIAWMQLRR